MHQIVSGCSQNLRKIQEISKQNLKDKELEGGVGYFFFQNMQINDVTMTSRI